MKDEKGHGSNAHNSGVAAIGKVTLHPKVLKTITKNPGGFSVKPTNGKMPSSGYMVSIPGHTQIVSEAALRGPQGQDIVKQYANEHASVLSDPRAHIGGWTDKETGKTYLDVSHNIKGRSAAVSAGRQHNQIAIWDVKHAKEIRTGGTGE
jgi:hypothetical protein